MLYKGGDIREKGKLGRNSEGILEPHLTTGVLTMAHSYAATLSSQQRSALKALAHHLNPVVLVGAKGISDTTRSEIAQALGHHELIKIQLPGNNTAEEKKAFEAELQNQLPKNAHFIHRIGRTVILYLEKDPEKAKFPLRDFKKRKTLA